MQNYFKTDPENPTRRQCMAENNLGRCDWACYKNSKRQRDHIEGRGTDVVHCRFISPQQRALLIDPTNLVAQMVPVRDGFERLAANLHMPFLEFYARQDQNVQCLWCDHVFGYNTVRMRAHFHAAGMGVGLCPNVPDHVRARMRQRDETREEMYTRALREFYNANPAVYATPEFAVSFFFQKTARSFD